MSYAGDITPEEAWKLLSDTPDAVLVDCRTEAEWRFVGVADTSSLGREVVYIEWNRTDGSHNDGFVDDLKAAAVTPRERPVLFLCRSGNRSRQAAKLLAGRGIEATDVTGGMTAWAREGLPVTGQGGGGVIA